LDRRRKKEVVARKTGHGKDVGDIVHHDLITLVLNSFFVEISRSWLAYIHSGKLTPNLDENTDMGTVDHPRLQKLEISNIGVLALKLDGFLDLLEFLCNPGVVSIAFAVDEDEDGLGLLPALLASEPTGRFG